MKPPIEFQDKPVPKPRTKTTMKTPVPYPRTKITFCAKAIKSGFESFNVTIKNKIDPLVQLNNTALAIKIFLKV